MSAAELERSTDDRRCPLRGERPRLGLVPAGPAIGAAADLLTVLRLHGGAGAAAARRGPPELAAGGSATAWILWQGLEPLPAPARRRILAGWRAQHLQREGARVVDGGCGVEIGGEAVIGSLRRALLAWLPVSHSEIAVYEGGLFGATPANALTLLLRPPTIWPLTAAVTAASLYPRGPRFDARRFEAVERHAAEHVGQTQLDRLREAAARIERQLPVVGLPVGSSIVAAGCAVLQTDDGWCRAIAARQLARYASCGAAVLEEERSSGRHAH